MPLNANPEHEPTSHYTRSEEEEVWEAWARNVATTNPALLNEFVSGIIEKEIEMGLYGVPRPNPVHCEVIE